MTQFLLILAVALTVGAIGFGVAVLVSGEDKLGAVEPDGRSVPLPAQRPLTEPDLGRAKFDTGLRGYRMDQVDAAMQRAAYDIGYKDELVKVLQAEVAALREGRVPDADALRRARQAALAPVLAGGAAALSADGPAIEPGSMAEPAPTAESEPAESEPAEEPEPAGEPAPAEEPAGAPADGPDPDEAERFGGPIAEEAGLPMQRTEPEPTEPEPTEPESGPTEAEPAQAEPARQEAEAVGAGSELEPEAKPELEPGAKPEPEVEPEPARAESAESGSPEAR